jgi:hypothetical protein
MNPLIAKSNIIPRLWVQLTFAASVTTFCDLSQPFLGIFLGIFLAMILRVHRKVWLRLFTVHTAWTAGSKLWSIACKISSDTKSSSTYYTTCNQGGELNHAGLSQTLSSPEMMSEIFSSVDFQCWKVLVSILQSVHFNKRREQARSKFTVKFFKHSVISIAIDTAVITSWQILYSYHGSYWCSTSSPSISPMRYCTSRLYESSTLHRLHYWTLNFENLSSHAYADLYSITRLILLLAASINTSVSTSVI